MVTERKSNPNLGVWIQSVGATLLFVLGFSTVFLIIGGVAGTVGDSLKAHKFIINIVAGILIIIFGVLLTGWIRVPWLMQETKVQVHNRRFGIVSAYFIGLAFAAGWSPCIGPILGSVISMAMAQETKYAAIWLLMVYSLGLGIPFIITSMFVASFIRFYSGFRKHLGTVNLIAGLLLIVVGIAIAVPLAKNGDQWRTGMMMFEDWFRTISKFDPTAGDQTLNAGHINFGSFMLAFFEGVLSFFTPCVLPMVPTFLAFITGLSVQELTTLSRVEKK